MKKKPATCQCLLCLDLVSFPVRRTADGIKAPHRPPIFSSNSPNFGSLLGSLQPRSPLWLPATEKVSAPLASGHSLCYEQDLDSGPCRCTGELWIQTPVVQGNVLCTNLKELVHLEQIRLPAHRTCQGQFRCPLPDLERGADADRLHALRSVAQYCVLVTTCAVVAKDM